MLQVEKVVAAQFPNDFAVVCVLCNFYPPNNESSETAQPRLCYFDWASQFLEVQDAYLKFELMQGSYNNYTKETKT
jgi:exonuclease III